MSEASAVMEATPTVMEVSRGPLVNLTQEERAEFRTTGELPKPRTEVAATSSDAKPVEGKAETAGESDTPKTTQEKPKFEPKPKQTAEERIAQLEATIEKIRKGKEEKETPKAEPSPAPKPVEATRPKPTADAKKSDGTPKFETYEDYIEDLADWKAEQREANSKQEAAKESQEKAKKAKYDAAVIKVDEAKERYPDFADKAQPFWDEVIVNPKVALAVKEVIDESDYFADLAYTIGGSKEELAKFVALPPGKQLRYIALAESLIAEELEGKAKPEVAPEKPRTAAPRPPAEVGGRSTAPIDDEYAAVAANDYRAASAAFKRKALANFK